MDPSASRADARDRTGRRAPGRARALAPPPSHSRGERREGVRWAAPTAIVLADARDDGVDRVENRARMSIVPPAIAWMPARWSPSKGERVRDAFPHAAAPSPPGRLWKRTRQKNKVPAPRPENGVAGHTRCERRAHLIGGALSTRCEQRWNLSRARVCAHEGPAGAMKPDRELSFTRALFYDDDLGSRCLVTG